MRKRVLGNDPSLADAFTSLGWALPRPTDLDLHNAEGQLAHLDVGLGSLR